MAITIQPDDGVTQGKGDEEVYLPGVSATHDLEGPFEFTYPRIGKLLSMQRRLRTMNPAQMAIGEIDGMLQWLADGFGPDAWNHIDARLLDETDVLDEEHMFKLFQLLNESSTGRPTTSSNGASRQPWKNTRTAAPSPQASVSEN